jgi:peptide/nickel transport system substrate-binding protein
METTLIPDSKNTDSPWSNLKVRQAAEYALDKEALAKAFGFGYVQPAYQYCTPDSKAFDAKLTPRTYNTARAKQLMTEAGYPNGFKTTIIAAPMGLDTNLVNAVQAYLSAVGIQCSIQYPQAAAWSQYISGTWKNGVLMGRILMYANPNTGFNGFGVHGSMFLSLKKPDGFDDLLNASLSTPDLDPSALQKCEGALYNDVTEIPINYSESEWAVTDRVQDSGIGSRGTWTWWEPQNVWLSK